LAAPVAGNPPRLAGRDPAGGQARKLGQPVIHRSVNCERFYRMFFPTRRGFLRCGSWPIEVDDRAGPREGSAASLAGTPQRASAQGKGPGQIRPQVVRVAHAGETSGWPGAARCGCGPSPLTGQRPGWCRRWTGQFQVGDRAIRAQAVHAGLTRRLRAPRYPGLPMHPPLRGYGKKVCMNVKLLCNNCSFRLEGRGRARVPASDWRTSGIGRTWEPGRRGTTQIHGMTEVRERSLHIGARRRTAGWPARGVPATRLFAVAGCGTYWQGSAEAETESALAGHGCGRAGFFSRRSRPRQKQIGLEVTGLTAVPGQPTDGWITAPMGRGLPSILRAPHLGPAGLLRLLPGRPTGPLSGHA